MMKRNSRIRMGIDCIGVGVGALIMNQQNRILLTKRGPLAKNEVGTWEIPGGAVEFGETLEKALKREVKEELGIEIEIVELLQVCDHILTKEGQHWVSPSYICKITKGTPQNLEPGKCDEIGWFSIDEAKKMKLSEVTIEDIKILEKEFK